MVYLASEYNILSFRMPRKYINMFPDVMLLDSQTNLDVEIASNYYPLSHLKRNGE